MALEIERRFLVPGWRGSWSIDATSITQGYVTLRSGRRIGVRVAGQEASLTVKYRVAPGVRRERVRRISLTTAFSLLEARCSGGCVDKIRYRVPPGSRTWEVDVFLGANEGLVIAEVELDHLGGCCAIAS